MYEIPSPEELREFLKKHGLTGSAAGRLVGVDARTIRRWTCDPEKDGARKMPWSAWALLRLITREVTVEEIRREEKHDS